MGRRETALRQFKLVAKLKPDVVLMDLRLPTMDGIQATREIKKVHPDAAIIILFDYDYDAYVAQAGAPEREVTLIKDAPGSLICHTIKAVHNGEAPMHSSIAQPHRQRDASEADLYHNYEARPLQHRRSLTPREMDVLKLLVEGLTNKAITRGLFISEVTAKKHVQSIIAKLDACDRAEAAVKAVRARLLDV